MYGCTCDTVFMGASDSVECDEALAVRAGEILATIPGVTKVIGYHQFDFGGGEDVTTMMRDVQAHGGMATELVFGMPLVAAHHNNYFDVDETVIPLAARAFATLAISLGENPIIR
jgi:aminobenzoyl-glutamate utilization protein A